MILFIIYYSYHFICICKDTQIENFADIKLEEGNKSFKIEPNIDLEVGKENEAVFNDDEFDIDINSNYTPPNLYKIENPEYEFAKLNVNKQVKNYIDNLDIAFDYNILTSQRPKFNSYILDTIYKRKGVLNNKNNKVDEIVDEIVKEISSKDRITQETENNFERNPLF